MSQNIEGMSSATRTLLVLLQGSSTRSLGSFSHLRNLFFPQTVIGTSLATIPQNKICQLQKFHIILSRTAKFRYELQFITHSPGQLSRENNLKIYQLLKRYCEFVSIWFSAP